MLEYVLVAVATLVGYHLYNRIKVLFTLFSQERKVLDSVHKDDREILLKYKKEWKNSKNLIIKNYQEVLPIRHKIIEEDYVFNPNDLVLQKVLTDETIERNKELIKGFEEQLAEITKKDKSKIVYEIKPNKPSYRVLIQKMNNLSKILNNDRALLEAMAESNPKELEDNEAFRKKCSDNGLDYHRVGVNIFKRKNSKGQNKRVVQISYLNGTRTDYVKKKELSFRSSTPDAEVMKKQNEELHKFIEEYEG